MRTFGLIPAAGKSRRMGQPKLLLSLGDKTVLEHVVSAVRAAGIEEIVVVVAPQADELARRALAAGAQAHRLAEDTPDMRATCLQGLAWLEQHYQPTSIDSWVLLPADHPTVHPEVVRAILSARQSHADKTIIVPTHQGRRGHPTWLSWSHVAALRALPSEHGLNVYIRAHRAETLELDWPSDEILRDLDTPEDWRKLMEGLP